MCVCCVRARAITITARGADEANLFHTTTVVVVTLSWPPARRVSVTQSCTSAARPQLDEQLSARQKARREEAKFGWRDEIDSSSAAKVAHLHSDSSKSATTTTTTFPTFAFKFLVSFCSLALPLQARDSEPFIALRLIWLLGDVVVVWGNFCLKGEKRICKCFTWPNGKPVIWRSSWCSLQLASRLQAAGSRIRPLDGAIGSERAQENLEEAR